MRTGQRQCELLFSLPPHQESCLFLRVEAAITPFCSTSRARSHSATWHRLACCCFLVQPQFVSTAIPAVRAVYRCVYTLGSAYTLLAVCARYCRVCAFRRVYREPTLQLAHRTCSTAASRLETMRCSCELPSLAVTEKRTGHTGVLGRISD